MFICAAMTEADIDHTLEVADEAFRTVREAGMLPPVEKLAILGMLSDEH
jgi:glutamate-1-semialdehyde 2,1-aminomutase